MKANFTGLIKGLSFDEWRVKLFFTLLLEDKANKITKKNKILLKSMMIVLLSSIKNEDFIF